MSVCTLITACTCMLTLACPCLMHLCFLSLLLSLPLLLPAFLPLAPLLTGLRPRTTGRTPAAAAQDHRWQQAAGREQQVRALRHPPSRPHVLGLLLLSDLACKTPKSVPAVVDLGPSALTACVAEAALWSGWSSHRCCLHSLHAWLRQHCGEAGAVDAALCTHCMHG